MIELKVNGELVQVEAEPDTPLLWALREQLGLTGTKFGCGIGMCGACTVHFNGMPMRSCVLPVGGAVGADIRTIEGLDHAVKQAWIEHQVPQCGYCQTGQLMAAAALLAQNRDPSDEDIARGMTNLCRCATYDRIREGIKAAAASLPPPPPPPEPEPEPAEGDAVEGDVPADAGEESDSTPSEEGTQ